MVIFNSYVKLPEGIFMIYDMSSNHLAMEPDPSCLLFERVLVESPGRDSRWTDRGGGLKKGIWIH